MENPVPIAEMKRNSDIAHSRASAREAWQAKTRETLIIFEVPVERLVVSSEPMYVFLSINPILFSARMEFLEEEYERD